MFHADSHSNQVYDYNRRLIFIDQTRNNSDLLGNPSARWVLGKGGQSPYVRIQSHRCRPRRCSGWCTS